MQSADAFLVWLLRDMNTSRCWACHSTERRGELQHHAVTFSEVDLAQPVGQPPRGPVKEGGQQQRHQPRSQVQSRAHPLPRTKRPVGKLHRRKRRVLLLLLLPLTKNLSGKNSSGRCHAAGSLPMAHRLTRTHVPWGTVKPHSDMPPSATTAWGSSSAAG